MKKDSLYGPPKEIFREDEKVEKDIKNKKEGKKLKNIEKS